MGKISKMTKFSLNTSCRNIRRFWCINKFVYNEIVIDHRDIENEYGNTARQSSYTN